MNEKPLISEDELTRLLFSKGTYRVRRYDGDDSPIESKTINVISDSAARTLARKMLAAPEMYEALKESLNCRYLRECQGCTTSFKAAIKLAEEGK